MKDFDSDFRETQAAREDELGDRSFQLGGKTFNYLANPPYTILEQVTAVGEKDGVELIRQLEEAAVLLIEDSERAAFRKALRDPKSKVTLQGLSAIINWVTEQQTGRPTEASSPSGPGGEPTSTESTDDSSSEPAVASAA